MASTRLTNNLRNRIAKKLLADRFDEEFKALEDEKAQLALEVYAKSFGDDVRRFEDLPSGWLEEKGKVKAELGGEVTELSFPKGVTKRFPAEKCSYWDGVTITLKVGARDSLAKRFRSISDRKSTLVSKKDQLEAEVRGALWSFNTTKKLIEEWPEIESIVSELLGSSHTPTNLPAVRVDVLNSKLGLEAVAV